MVRLGDAFPAAALDDHADRRMREPESFSKLVARSFLRGVKRPDLLDVGNFDLGGVHRLSVDVAPSLNRIVNIVGNRPRRQVGWIDAQPNIARMSNHRTGGDFSDEKGVNDAMDAVIPAAETDATVSVSALSARPQPASIRFVYLCPESSEIVLRSHTVVCDPEGDPEQVQSRKLLKLEPMAGYDPAAYGLRNRRSLDSMWDLLSEESEESEGCGEIVTLGHLRICGGSWSDRGHRRSTAKIDTRRN